MRCGNNIKRISPAVAGLVLAASLGQGPAVAEPNSDMTTTTWEATAVAASISDSAPAAVADSTADVTTLSDGTTVATTGDGTAIMVADEGSGGVTVSSPGGETVGIAADIPHSTQGTVVDGMTVFDLGDHAVVYQPVSPENGGGIRMLFTMDDASSPTTFKVDFDLPAGARLISAEGGSVTAVDAEGQPVGSVPAPWAKDANGSAVPTSYEIQGDTLVQHVYPGPTTAFPVVSDPFWIPAAVVWKIVRCGFGAYLGYIASAGWRWWNRAVALIGGCILGI